MNRTCWTERHRAGLMAAAAILVAVALGASAVLPIHHQLRNGTVIAGVAAPADAAGGWQDYFTQDLQQGTNLIFTYTCPESAPTPVNGSFSPTTHAKVGLELIANYRPAKKKSSWTWEIHWPSGAPANSQINFNVYCVP